VDRNGLGTTAVECTIWKVERDRELLQVIWTYQLMIDDGGVGLLGGSI
jgi:hypothetical protein